MKKVFFLLMVMIGYLSPFFTYAQEDEQIDIEQSAEVFLEDYSDEFQENFFEGLKQKGIQNYDRAITYFMECKRLEPENKVVAFELAKSHLLEKELLLAEEYALEALKGNPENYWYAETLTDIVAAKKSNIDRVTSELPWDNGILRENMAKIYFNKGDYEIAKTILSGVIGTKKYGNLKKRILDSIAKQDIQKEPVSFSVSAENNKEMNAMEQYKMKINGLMGNDVLSSSILQLSEEAMESFPVQPYFYYANGYALNRTNKYREAIEVLETALDYLINDIPLENMIYKELVDAFTAIDDPVKADSYKRKIKPGF